VSDDLCPGSGGGPTELVILDVGPWDPPGTCPVCGKSVYLTGGVRYRVPNHKLQAAVR